MKTSDIRDPSPGFAARIVPAIVIIALVGVAAASILVYRTWFDRSEGAPRVSVHKPTVRDPNDVLAAELALLRREVNALREVTRGNDLPGAVREERKPEPTATDRTERTPLTAEEAREANELKVEQTVGVLEKVHGNEAVDATWARERESAIRDYVTGLQNVPRDKYKDPSMAAAVSNIKLVSCDCRSTLCRIELEHGANAKTRDALIHMLGSAPFDGQGFFVESPDRKKLTTYNARQGHALPRIELGT